MYTHTYIHIQEKLCMCVCLCLHIYQLLYMAKKKDLGGKFSILITVPGLKHEVHCKERRLGRISQKSAKHENSPRETQRS